MARTKQTFEEWMKKVNKIIADRVGGLTAEDIPDVDYRSMYEDGNSPKAAASYAIKNAMDG